jgi:hypothetical protein
MAQPGDEVLEMHQRAGTPGICMLPDPFPSSFVPRNFANVHLGDMFPTTPDEERLFVGSPAPLFTMYRKSAEEDDKEMTQRWQKDANSILLFVSPQLSKYHVPHHQNVKRVRPVYFLLQLRHCSR